MSNRIIPVASAIMFSAGIAIADVPKVAVDIAPVHSLVSKVMNGVGRPQLIIPAGASPHEYQLRPSEAKALQDANLVFWIGEDLSPWLKKGITTFIEVILNQELGEPFRRDAMKKPVRVAGIKKTDMKPQKSLN